MSDQGDRDPQSQFQIGDAVLYKPEGIYAIVEGYVWLNAIGELPRIGLYKLSCGISVSANTIERSGR